MQLLQTTESSIGDVHGLHAKLDRKRNVEAHNQEAQSTFQQRFHSNLQDMRQEVTDFTDKYHALNKQTVDTLGKQCISAVGCHLYISGMSIFSFSAEFCFFVVVVVFCFSFTFRFFKNHFPLFLKSRQQKKTKTTPPPPPLPPPKSRSLTPRLSGEFKELATVGRVQRASVSGCFFRLWSEFESKVLALEIRHSKSDTRNYAPP